MFDIRYKPSSVRHLRDAPIIYLRRQSLAASSNLPPDIGRVTLNCRYTRSCNPSGVLTHTCHHGSGGLLPHLFTLTRQAHTWAAGGYSLLRYYDLTAIFPLRSTALYVARTFLPPLAGTAVEPASAAAKVRINSQFTIHNAQLFFADSTPPQYLGGKKMELRATTPSFYNLCKVSFTKSQRAPRRA